MTGRFTNVILNGSTLEVTGTFKPEDLAVNHATILFLIVQGDNADMVWTHGAGVWQRGQNGNKWIGVAPAQGKSPGGKNGTIKLGVDNDRVRGIAVALVVLPAQKRGSSTTKFDPPTIQGLTWCATSALTVAPPPAARRRAQSRRPTARRPRAGARS
jgi:hypothetical protein